MSNQSGISASPSLVKEFPEFVSSSDIAAILAIDHAKEHVTLESRINGSVCDVRKYLGEGQEAKYIILRAQGSATPEFAFVQFMPDLAPLSSKMKYASSHATIHRQLGGSSTFTTTIFWTELDEVSDEGLKAHRDHEDAPAPLTEEEESLATAKELESAQGTRGASVAGQSTLAVHANVTTKAKMALNSSSLKRDTAVILKVTSDESEAIDLVNTLPASELSKEFQELSEPRYVVIDLDGKIAFAFVCPRSASIKQRMLFASTRISFLEYLKTLRSVDAVIETFEPENDLELVNLKEELHSSSASTESQPQTESLGTSNKPKFQRPRPPKRR